MIKAVIFDCFGVLTTDTWKAFVADLPDSVDKDKLRELNWRLDSGVLSRQEFVQEVEAVSGHKPQLIEDNLNQNIYKNTPLLEFIRELKKDYKIGMISNVSSSWITDSFLSQEELALFDDMVFSFSAGTVKPDSEIYELACKNLRVQPTEAVFIDDIPRYCDAAKDVGLEAFIYTSLPELKRDLAGVLNHG